MDSRIQQPINYAKLTDDGVLKPARNLAVQQAPLNYNFNEDNNDELITWIQENSRKDPNFTWRGYKIIKIDTFKNNVIVMKNGKQYEKRLPAFLDEARLDIKFKKGSTRLDGKVVNRNDVINLIKQDIQNERPFKGKKIISIDPSTNTITLESDSIFQIPDKMSIDSFILDYLNNRTFGYKDSDTTIQDLQEQTRLQNIEDMASAFKQALGIKPPKIVAYAPAKETRLVENVCSGMIGRETTDVWTSGELTNIYRTGNVPYSNKKVSGELNNQFVPALPELKAIKVSQQ